MVEPVKKTIEVNCSTETAFDIFTAKIADWWPLDSNSISAMSGGTAKSLIFEPEVGGQIYEITAGGDREDWARVTAFEPGRRFALAWHVMTPEDKATEVEVSFTSNGDGTRVDLVHTGWEVLEDNGQQSRDNYNGGWVNVFEVRYAQACAA